MRRFLILFVLLATLSLFAKAENLWSGSKAIDWNNGSFVQISSDKFSSSEVADIITLTYTFTGGTDWPQIGLSDGASWTALPGVDNIGLSAGMTTSSVTLTSDMLAKLKNGGLVVSGIGFTLTSIDIQKGTGAAGFENAVWIGTRIFPSDWTGSQSLPSSTFAHATSGMIFRVKYTIDSPGAMIVVRNSSWKDIAGYDFKQCSGNHTDFTINSDLLKAMQSGGVILQGIGFTLTSAELITTDALSRLQATVPVVNNWLWVNQTPRIQVNISNATATSADARVVLQIATDKLAAVNTLTKNISVAANSSESVSFDVEVTPGFYHATALVNDETAGDFIFGYNPEEIVSAPDAASDFDEFWSSAKTELSAVAAEYTLTEIPSKSTASRKVYLVEMKSVKLAEGDQGIFRAYYAEPTGSETYPALIHYSGYDSGNYDPWCPGGNDNPGYAELVVSTRGQLINNRSPYTNTYGDWFAYGFGSQDTYYYRGAYMDCLRSIDFIKSREKVQQNNIFAEGSSQGGAFTIAAAALSGEFNAIAPSIPFMGDFPDYFQLASWPASVAFAQQKTLGMSDVELYKMLSYFDTKNLATKITCPVYMNFSLQDNVCPPHTNIAPYNNLRSSEKKYLVNPQLQHSPANNWNSEMMKFFKEHMKDASGIKTMDVASASNSNARVYSLTGQRVSRNYKGIVIRNGRKVMY